jgi:putative modified peptide
MNPTASKQQMLRLFDKLANDDLFRSRFERNPKSALVEAGFPAEEVAIFPAEQLAPGTLAAKSLFAAEYSRVADDVAAQCLCMVMPGPMLASCRTAGVATTLARAA